jgi:hypothetical protein
MRVKLLGETPSLSAFVLSCEVVENVQLAINWSNYDLNLTYYKPYNYYNNK